MDSKWQDEIVRIVNVVASNLNATNHLQALDDMDSSCKQLFNPRIGIALLAPFNHGKSSLINAILKKDILPTKAVRTTGTVISIRYGKKISITITLKSGESITSKDTKILNEFTVLNRKGKCKEDVLSVEVLYPHKLLKKGIEIIDLPGTNDSKEHDKLIRDKLLGVDIVIHVLKATDNLTLKEQNDLRQWLLERGIKTIIFVLNHMNYIEPEDQEEVYNEVDSSIAVFKTDLPQGCRKLYRVDVLPALEAQKERDFRKIYSSGIIDFEATLMTLVSVQKSRIQKVRLLRAINLIFSVMPVLSQKVFQLVSEIEKAKSIRDDIYRKGKQREKYLKDELKLRIKRYQDFLRISNLKDCYQLDLSEAIEEGDISSWKNQKIARSISTFTTNISNWMNQSCKEVSKFPPATIRVIFPSNPSVSLPSRKERSPLEVVGDFFNGNANRRRLDKEYEIKEWKAYKKAASKYLSKLSKKNTAILEEYHKQSDSLIVFDKPQLSIITVSKINDLKKINESITEIKSLELLQHEITLHKSNKSRKTKFLFLYRLNFLHCLISTVINFLLLKLRVH